MHDRLLDRRDTGDRAQLRAEIDAYVAHLYGLSCDDFAYILDTFPVLKKKEEKAFGEFMSNAIIHRDYSILGSDIKVAIFDDMLEITSPGPLPDTLSPEELGTGRSEIRNRVLAPIFKNLKLIEAWGTGIQRMRSELVGYPEIELILQEAGHAFQVQFSKKRTGRCQTTNRCRRK